MKSLLIHGTSEDDVGKRWFFDFYQQWSGIFRPGNWVDFTLIDIQGEWSPYKGSCEFSAGLLGFYLRITYVYDSAADREALQRAEELLGIKPEDSFEAARTELEKSHLQEITTVGQLQTALEELAEVRAELEAALAQEQKP